MSKKSPPARPTGPTEGPAKMTGDVCMIPRDFDVFTLGEQIGTGSFATVYKAINNKTKATIAVKCYRLKLKDRTTFKRAATEMAFLKFLQHPNIITYICSDIKNFMYLGLEYSPYGCLMNIIEKQFHMSEEFVQAVMKQLLSAVCYLHSKHILHSDIKPENIIVFNEKPLRIKLTDFGLAEVIMKNQTVNSKSGSYFYMSPEIHLGFPADYTSDLFSSGVLMYEMLFGEKPFSLKMSKDEYISMLRKRVPIAYPDTITSTLSQDCMNLVKNLLQYDKDKRLKGEALANHPFLRIELVQDDQNHYYRAYECFLSAVDLCEEKMFGTAYIAIKEAVLHLQIYSTLVDEVGLFRYVVMKHKEFVRFSDRILDRVITNESNDSLIPQSDTERLRYLLHASPDLLAAYDLCVIGEMYYMQDDPSHGLDLLKSGIQVLLSKIPHEPEGLRRKLLGSKISQWLNMMELCEGTNPGPSQGRSSRN